MPRSGTISGGLSSTTTNSETIAILYDIVGGATGLEGAWDVPKNQVWPKDGSAAIAVGTATGNATNLRFPSSSTPAVSSQTTQYTAIQDNTTAGIVNTQRYNRRRFISSINGAVLSDVWIDRTAGTALNTTQVAAINIGADFAANPSVVTTAVALQSQDWLVVPNAGDTTSGLARRAIAREYVIQDEVGSVAPFWTNANNVAITAPARTNLVKAERGYPETLLVEYALNSAPTAFLNGFAIRLPNGGFDLYSDYALTALVAQGAAAAEAVAGSIRPRAGASVIASNPIGVASFSPVQTSIPAGFTVPAISGQITVAVTALSIATNLAFVAGDIVIATQVKTDGTTSKMAWFSVNSVTGNDVTMTLLNRTFSSLPGDVFSANATELTGQSRLRDIPTAATQAVLTCVASLALNTAALNAADPFYQVAASLYNGLPLAYWGLKIGTLQDIDLVQRNGYEMVGGAIVRLENRTEIDAFRSVSNSTLALLPVLEVVYY